MENASKAMLIAGAVLIMMVLIAFALIIFNSTSDPAEAALDTSKGIRNSANSASQAAVSEVLGLNQWIK